MAYNYTPPYHFMLVFQVINIEIKEVLGDGRGQLSSWRREGSVMIHQTYSPCEFWMI